MKKHFLLPLCLLVLSSFSMLKDKKAMIVSMEMQKTGKGQILLWTVKNDQRTFRYEVYDISGVEAVKIGSLKSVAWDEEDVDYMFVYRGKPEIENFRILCIDDKNKVITENKVSDSLVSSGAN